MHLACLISIKCVGSSTNIVQNSQVLSCTSQSSTMHFSCLGKFVVHNKLSLDSYKLCLGHLTFDFELECHLAIFIYLLFFIMELILYSLGTNIFVFIYQLISTRREFHAFLVGFPSMNFVTWTQVLPW